MYVVEASDRFPLHRNVFMVLLISDWRKAMCVSIVAFAVRGFMTGLLRVARYVSNICVQSMLQPAFRHQLSFLVISP